jgi:hypothetical protein
VLLAVSTARVEVALIEWEEGRRRFEELLDSLTSARAAVVRRVVEEITDEVERRIGATFTLAQLTELYDGSEPWCREVAQRTTDQVWAHDLSAVQAAAFGRYARNATDYR